jgi:hypothetical protein
MECFRSVTDLPPVQTAAGLGGNTYFALIVTTQIAGASTELVLIKRLRDMDMMPPQEMFVLLTALAIEITRMFMVDVFMLQEYLKPNQYSVFRLGGPEQLDVGADDESWMSGSWNEANTSTQLAISPTVSSVPELYYIATSAQAWDPDPVQCSLFGRDSALLDYNEDYGGPATWRPQSTGGHPRFSHLGPWVDKILIHLCAVYS